jgi:RNA polymerase sigma factor (sigma-70 family)
VELRIFFISLIGQSVNCNIYNLGKLLGQTNHTRLSDEELLQAYRRDGDSQWLGFLLQRYTTLLLGVALKFLKDKTQAEDAVQHVFIKVLTHIPTEEILNFKGWLYVLMRNHCLQQLRDKSYNAGLTALENYQSAETDKEEIVLREQSIAQMKEAIEQLKEEQKNAISLFYLEKYSYEQIIEKTGYTFMQVKSFIQNGKRNLRTILLKKTNSRQ